MIGRNRNIIGGIVMAGVLLMQALYHNCYPLAGLFDMTPREARVAAEQALAACGVADRMRLVRTGQTSWRDKSADNVYYVYEDREHPGNGCCVEVVTNGRQLDPSAGKGMEGPRRFMKYPSNVSVEAGVLTNSLLDSNILTAIDKGGETGVEKYYFEYDWRKREMEFMGYEIDGKGRNSVESYYREWDTPCYMSDTESVTLPSEYGIVEHFRPAAIGQDNLREGMRADERICMSALPQ